MLRLLLQLCRRPAIRFGLARDPRSRNRNTRFASFLVDNNRSSLDPNMHDAVLKGRKAVRSLLVILLTGGGAWIVVESAQALTLF